MNMRTLYAGMCKNEFATSMNFRKFEDSIRGFAMAGRPPPGYNDAVRMPGRAYEGYIPPAVCPVRYLPSMHFCLVFSRGDGTAHVCCVRLPSSRGFRQANAAAHQAVHHSECPICFEPMHGEPSGVLAQAQIFRSQYTKISYSDLPGFQF